VHLTERQLGHFGSESGNWHLAPEEVEAKDLANGWQLVLASPVTTAS
jgi:hypothetical protein